jgi:hypothetical protein
MEADTRPEPMKKNRPPTGSRRPRRAPFVFLLLFVILLLIGIAAEEPMRVLEQARQVCLSCIGIG